MLKLTYWIHHPDYLRDYRHRFRLVPNARTFAGQQWLGWCTHWIDTDKRRAMAVARKLPRKGLTVDIVRGREVIKRIIGD